MIQDAGTCRIRPGRGSRPLEELALSSTLCSGQLFELSAHLARFYGSRSPQPKLLHAYRTNAPSHAPWPALSLGRNSAARCAEQLA